jgi:hypothetical protein
MIRRALLILPALALVAGAAACGGGKSDDAAAKTDRSAAGGGSSTDAAGAGQIGDAATAADAGDGSSSKGGGSGSSGTGGPLTLPSGKPGEVGSAIPKDFDFTGKGGDEFCAEMTALQKSYEQSGDPDLSFSDVSARLAKITPPPELADTWPDFVQVTQRLGDTDADNPDEVDAATMAKFATASDKVAAYLTKVCHV